MAEKSLYEFIEKYEDRIAELEARIAQQEILMRSVTSKEEQNSHAHRLNIRGSDFYIDTLGRARLYDITNYETLTGVATGSWTDIASFSSYYGALFLVKVIREADGANQRTYLVLFGGTVYGSTAVVVSSVAAGSSGITASFQGAGTSPYRLQINPNTGGGTAGVRIFRILVL